MILKPICVSCQRFYRPRKNGVHFIESMPAPGVNHNNGLTPGTSHPEHWRPYKLWEGDEWECHGCGSRIIVGVGFEPMSEHYKPEFGQMIESYRPTVTVNDC